MYWQRKKSLLPGDETHTLVIQPIASHFTVRAIPAQDLKYRADILQGLATVIQRIWKKVV
jgi:hypothetical protein